MRPRNFFSPQKAVAVNRGHLEMETSTRNIPILVCPPTENTSSDSLIRQMSNHIKSSNGETEIQEEIVQAKMEDVNIKTENIQNHEDGIYRCQYCIFEGKTSYILQRHIVKHTGPLRCSKCNMGFSSKGSGKDSHKKHEESCDGSNSLLLLGEGHIDHLQNNFEQNSTETKIVKVEEDSNPSQVPQIPQEVSNPSPTQFIQKEEMPHASPPIPPQSNVRNSKFQEYFLKQCALRSIDPAPSQIMTPIPRKSLAEPAKRKLSNESTKRKPPKEELKSPKKKPERNQFGTVGEKYEKFWCCGCDNWVPGGKANATNHLKRHHEGEECSIIHITKSGMLKVDKEDWIMDKATKKAKIDANDAIYSPDTSLNSSLNSSNESSFNSMLNSSNDSSLYNSSTAASSFNESSF